MEEEDGVVTFFDRSLIQRSTLTDPQTLVPAQFCEIYRALALGTAEFETEAPLDIVVVSNHATQAIQSERAHKYASTPTPPRPHRNAVLSHPPHPNLWNNNRDSSPTT